MRFFSGKKAVDKTIAFAILLFQLFILTLSVSFYNYHLYSSDNSSLIYFQVDNINNLSGHSGRIFHSNGVPLYEFPASRITELSGLTINTSRLDHIIFNGFNVSFSASCDTVDIRVEDMDKNIYSEISLNKSYNRLSIYNVTFKAIYDMCEDDNSVLLVLNKTYPVFNYENIFFSYIPEKKDYLLVEILVKTETASYKTYYNFTSEYKSRAEFEFEPIAVCIYNETYAGFPAPQENTAYLIYNISQASGYENYLLRIDDRGYTIERVGSGYIRYSLGKCGQADIGAEYSSRDNLYLIMIDSSVFSYIYLNMVDLPVNMGFVNVKNIQKIFADTSAIGDDHKIIISNINGDFVDTIFYINMTVYLSGSITDGDRTCACRQPPCECDFVYYLFDFIENITKLRRVNLTDIPDEININLNHTYSQDATEVTNVFNITLHKTEIQPYINIYTHRKNAIIDKPWLSAFATANFPIRDCNITIVTPENSTVFAVYPTQLSFADKYNTTVMFNLSIGGDINQEQNSGEYRVLYYCKNNFVWENFTEILFIDKSRPEIKVMSNISEQRPSIIIINATDRYSPIKACKITLNKTYSYGWKKVYNNTASWEINLERGNYSLEVICEDVAGNWNKIYTTYFVNVTPELTEKDIVIDFSMDKIEYYPGDIIGSSDFPVTVSYKVRGISTEATIICSLLNPDNITVVDWTVLNYDTPGIFLIRDFYRFSSEDLLGKWTIICKTTREPFKEVYKEIILKIRDITPIPEPSVTPVVDVVVSEDVVSATPVVDVVVSEDVVSVTPVVDVVVSEDVVSVTPVTVTPKVAKNRVTGNQMLRNQAYSAMAKIKELIGKSNNEEAKKRLEALLSSCKRDYREKKYATCVKNLDAAQDIFYKYRNESENIGQKRYVLIILFFLSVAISAIIVPRLSRSWKNKQVSNYGYAGYGRNAPDIIKSQDFGGEAQDEVVLQSPYESNYYLKSRAYSYAYIYERSNYLEQKEGESRYKSEIDSLTLVEKLDKLYIGIDVLEPPVVPVTEEDKIVVEALIHKQQTVGDFVTLTRLGVFYYRRGDYTTAKYYFHIALNQNLEGRIVLRNMVETCLTLNQNKEALSYMIKLVEIDEIPSNLKKLAEIYMLLGRIDDAIRYVEKSLSQEPEDSEQWHFLAKLYTKKEQPRNAISALKKAIEHDRNNKELYLDLAYLYDQIDEKVTAEKTYERILEIDSLDLTAREWLFSYWMRLGLDYSDYFKSRLTADDLIAARKYLEKALRLDVADSRSFKMIKKRLSEIDIRLKQSKT